MFSVRQYAMNSVYKIYCVVLHTKSGILFHKRYCNTKAIKLYDGFNLSCLFIVKFNLSRWRKDKCCWSYCIVSNQVLHCCCFPLNFQVNNILTYNLLLVNFDLSLFYQYQKDSLILQMNVVLPIKNFFLQYLKKEDISDCWRSVGLSGENTFMDSF